MGVPRTADPDRALAHSAMAAFGLCGRVDRVATGLDSTYRVRTDSGPVYAMRVGGVLPIRRPAAVMAEAAWLTDLSRRPGLTVPRVVPLPDGGQVLCLEDETGKARGTLILTWMPGRRLRSRFDAPRAQLLGPAAARLHGAAKGFELPDQAWIKTWDSTLMAGSGDLDHLGEVAGSAAIDLADAMMELLTSALGALGRDGFGLINADLGPHNTVWSGRQAGLVDFNDSGWGYFAFDLARVIQNLWYRDGGPALAQALLEGYQELATLPEGFGEYGTLFRAAADMFLARYLAPQVNRRGPDTASRIHRLVRAIDAAISMPQGSYAPSD